MRAYVGLGSNLGDREGAIRAAVARIEADPEIDVLRVSSLIETDPVGYLDQPRFLNGACEVETELSPHELLARLAAIERGLGRARGVGPRFGPRPIDLDLLLCGETVVDDPPHLVVPHSRLPERRFALEPLLELDPALALPDGRRVSDLLAGLE